MAAKHRPGSVGSNRYPGRPQVHLLTAIGERVPVGVGAGSIEEEGRAVGNGEGGRSRDGGGGVGGGDGTPTRRKIPSNKCKPIKYAVPTASMYIIITTTLHILGAANTGIRHQGAAAAGFISSKGIAIIADTTIRFITIKRVFCPQHVPKLMRRQIVKKCARRWVNAGSTGARNRRYNNVTYGFDPRQPGTRKRYIILVKNMANLVITDNNNRSQMICHIPQ